MADPILIFVGTDRSQALAVRVLEYSIRRHTVRAVEVRSLADLALPQPKDARQSQRTGFSFARWAIPGLCHHQGRAIYLDADMLVFRDIGNLWDVRLDDAKIAVLEPQGDGHANVHRGKNETSVMVLDCARCAFSAVELIAGLDGKYDYGQLMRELCFLDDKEIARTIPAEWNSMEEWSSSTGLLHYTIMPTQPWVSARNPLGYLWINEVRRMLSEGALSRNLVKQEIDLGYFRPSLMVEIDEGPDPAMDEERVRRLEAIDRDAGYVPHRSVQEWDRARAKAVRRYERQLARQQGIASYLTEVAKDVRSSGMVLARRAKHRLVGH